MNISCPECQSVFRVDPARVPGPGIRARCSVCGGIIPITTARSWTDDFAVSHDAASLTAAPARSGGGQSAARSVTAPDRPGVHDAPRGPMAGAAAGGAGLLTPPAGMSRSITPTRVPPFAPGRRATPSAVPIVPSAPAPAPAQAAPRAEQRSMAPPPVQSTALPAPASTNAPPAGLPSAQPSTLRPAAPPPRADAGVPTRPTAAPSAPSSRPPDVPIGSPAARSAPIQVPPAASSPPSAPAARPQAGSSEAGGTHSARSDATAATPAKAPINPFLANDPNQKAKRLARALVSDMVAYHPQKRDEGLRAGTLKQLFREEIKKSYEEYVDQIGKEFAESTSHFQDALNDVLAGGKKVF